MFNKKSKRILSTVVAGVLIFAMILGCVVSFIM